jgi:outer membrane protein OmpA-like peptidoglycan-associated protein/methionine-rich copper-binding protein CopC
MNNTSAISQRVHLGLADQLMSAIKKCVIPILITASLFLPIVASNSAHASDTSAVSAASTLQREAFSYTGTSDTFVVPAGVTEIQVYVRGGAGPSIGAGIGGKGAYVSTVLEVVPSSTITVNVGALGLANNKTVSFGGGGAAGHTNATSQGGGASDLRIGGSALSNRAVVAGGGGGGGSSGSAGHGGTPNGTDGTQTVAGFNGLGGRGATQSAGGAGGAFGGGCTPTVTGSAGALGEGGSGAPQPGGSGGGGGYYGGGGGGNGCNTGPGGGGSSWADPLLTTETSYSLATSLSAGCIEIVWPVDLATPSTCLGVADTAAPTLSSTVPANNATGVSLTSDIVLNFSERVSTTDGKNIVIKKVSDNSIVESISLTDTSKVIFSGTTVTITPTSPFTFKESYYITIDSGGFKDRAGNSYAGISLSTALTFTAEEDTTPPTLVSSDPKNNATDVPVTSDITLNFSEDVVATSNKIIKVRKTSDDSTIEEVSVSDATKVIVAGALVTINPSTDFIFGESLYITIDSGAFEDQAGNPYAGITSSTELTFTTVALPPPATSDSENISEVTTPGVTVTDSTVYTTAPRRVAENSSITVLSTRQTKTQRLRTETPSVCLTTNDDIVFIDNGKCNVSVLNKKTGDVLRRLRTTVIDSEVVELGIGNEIAILAPIYFDNGSSKLSNTAKKRITQLKDQISDAGTVLVTGHSGIMLGDTPENRALSQARAVSTVREMKRVGATGPFFSLAVGAADPEVNSTSRSAQTKNRRVVIVLVP